jgi:hypothetical protein
MTGQVTLAGPASTPFGGVAVWQLGDPRYDIEATLRTPIPGASEYAGADQP